MNADEEEEKMKNALRVAQPHGKVSREMTKKIRASSSIEHLLNKTDLP